MEQIRIVAAAVRVHGLLISKKRPARHSDIINEVAENFSTELIHPDDQGFLDSNGDFRERRQAKVIALDADQLLPDANRDGLLYSEDVW